MNITLRAAGATEISHEFATASVKIPAVVYGVLQHWGQLLTTRVQAKASGRPGPNAPTGDYRRSISLEMSQFGTFMYASVGTNKPQGRRLEFGFEGRDSLGRIYHQPPYPHFGPATDEIEGPFEQAMSATVGRALGERT